MDSTLDFFANSGDAVCAINNQQKIVYWNSTAEKLLGFTVSEVIGQPCWKLLAGETLDGTLYCRESCPIYRQVKAGNPVPHFDLRINTCEGERITTNLSTLSVPAHNGKPKKNQAALVHLFRVSQAQNNRPHKLRIHMLGPLVVWRSDGSQVSGIHWNRAKVRALLVYLALQQGQRVSSQELIEALWPDKERAAALRNLNTTVYNLRRSLEPSLERGSDSRYISYESGHYWLSGDGPHWLDVTTFRTKIKQARSETAVNQATLLYQDALELYRGSYLVDLIAAGFGSPVEQNRLHQLFLAALEELGNLYLQQAQAGKARDTYLKALSLDPYRDSACQQLAALSKDTDSRLDNLAYCQRLAAALKDELDLILSQELLTGKDAKNVSD